MLKQVSLDQIVNGEVTREMGYLVVAMRHYPRFLKRELRDEYIHVLSPSEPLFEEFKTLKRKLEDHNKSFRLVRYEERFSLDAEAMSELKRLAEMSKVKNVYIACQCGPGERCHRDLLLILARQHFLAETEPLRMSYPIFEKRASTVEAIRG